MMTDTTEVEKWRPVHGGDAWVRVTEYDDLAAKLAEAERVARYETDIAQQALDQIKAEKARAESAEAKLAKVEEDRDDLQIALASARKQLERYIGEAEARIAHLENHIEAVAKDTHKIMVAYATAHATVLGVAQTLEDAYWSREVTPTPTAVELMARIQTGAKG